MRKTKDQALTSPRLVINYEGEVFEFPGDPGHQGVVLRWAVETVYCYEDRPEEITDSQLNVLKRHFPSFAVIYSSPSPQSTQLTQRLTGMARLCERTGRTLVFRCHSDLAPLSLYLPLDRAPVLVLYAHNIPLVYTGAGEPEAMMTWLAETHDTNTNMIRLSSRHLARIIAQERTVYVLFISGEVETLELLRSRAATSRLDRLGVVVVSLESLDEVSGLGVTQLPALVMFKHGLPIVYSGNVTEDEVDQVSTWTASVTICDQGFQLLSWISKESYRDNTVKVTGLEGPLTRADLDGQHGDQGVSTVLVKPHRYSGDGLFGQRKYNLPGTPCRS